MSRHSQIRILTGVQGGKPVIRGTRVPVEVLAGAVAAGDDIEQVAADYRVTPDQVRAALGYAADLVATESVLEIPRRREPATRRRRSPARRRA